MVKFHGCNFQERRKYIRLNSALMFLDIKVPRLLCPVPLVPREVSRRQRISILLVAICQPLLVPLSHLHLRAFRTAPQPGTTRVRTSLSAEELSRWRLVLALWHGSGSHQLSAKLHKHCSGGWEYVTRLFSTPLVSCSMLSPLGACPAAISNSVSFLRSPRSTGSVGLGDNVQASFYVVQSLEPTHLRSRTFKRCR